MPVTERSFLGSEDCSESTQAIGQQCRRAGDRSHDILGAKVDERLATMIDVLLKSGRQQLAVPIEAPPETVPNAFRGSADRRQFGRPTIPPVDEFGREQAHDGE